MLSVLFLLYSVSAKEVVLFYDYDPVPDYDAKVRSIAADDVVVFSKKSFHVTKRLGAGTETVVLEIQEYGDDGTPKALRIAKDLAAIQERNLAAFYEGWQQLKARGAPVVEVFFHWSDPYEYLVVEEIQNSLVLDVFDRFKFSQIKQAGPPLVAALLEFAKKVSRFKNLSRTSV